MAADQDTAPAAIPCPSCGEGTLKPTKDGTYLACYIDYCGFIITPKLLDRAKWFRNYFSEGPTTPDA